MKNIKKAAALSLVALCAALAGCDDDRGVKDEFIPEPINPLVSFDFSDYKVDTEDIITKFPNDADFTLGDIASRFAEDFGQNIHTLLPATTSFNLLKEEGGSPLRNFEGNLHVGKFESSVCQQGRLYFEHNVNTETSYLIGNEYLIDVDDPLKDIEGAKILLEAKNNPIKADICLHSPDDFNLLYEGVPEGFSRVLGPGDSDNFKAIKFNDNGDLAASLIIEVSVEDGYFVDGTPVALDENSAIANVKYELYLNDGGSDELILRNYRITASKQREDISYQVEVPLVDGQGNPILNDDGSPVYGEEERFYHINSTVAHLESNGPSVILVDAKDYMSEARIERRLDNYNIQIMLHHNSEDIELVGRMRYGSNALNKSSDVSSGIGELGVEGEVRNSAILSQTNNLLVNGRAMFTNFSGTVVADYQGGHGGSLDYIYDVVRKQD